MRRIFLALGGLILLAAVGFFVVKVGPYAVMAVSLWRAMSTTDAEELARREERVLALWRSEVTAGAEPWERYPPTEANATALVLEDVAGALGIDCSTPHHPTTPPEAGAAARWEEVGPRVKEYFETLRASARAEAPPLPAELRDWLQDAGPEIDRARRLLLSSEPPRWERDLEAAAEGPLPNLVCQLDLHRLLLLAALEAADEPPAGSFLEAGWRLRRAADSNPILISQLIHLVQLGDELSVLRRRCAAGGPWEERLRALHPRLAMLRSIQLDGWLSHQTFRTEPMFYAQSGPDGELPLYFQLLVVDYIEAVQQAVERLERQDPLLHDPKAFGEELDRRLPRWSILARLFTLQPGAWIKAVRSELVIEHALRILRAQEELARGREPAPARTPSVAVPGLVWTDEPSEEGFRISLDGNLEDGGTAPVALAFVLDEGICRSGSE